MASDHNLLIEVKDLVKYYPMRGGLLQRTRAHVHAVDHVSFEIQRGETLGLVGESGCGKTTTGRTILRLIPATGGQVLFQGLDVLRMSPGDLKRARGDLQIIFQDPYGSLDPRMPIGDIIGEGLRAHGVTTTKERKRRVQDVMLQVGLNPAYMGRYPHEFSGGQRQRIGIARALILRPKFVVCDEPVSALDVSIQSQVLNLLKDLQRQMSLTYLFIAHNLAVVKYISDRIGVMYLGKIVEMAEKKDLFENALHPYTKALLSAIPQPDPTLKRQRVILAGDVPSPVNPPAGCRFHPRCPIFVKGHCDVQEPEWKEYRPGHWAACHYAMRDS